MRYTLDEALQESLRRASELKKRRARMKTGLLSSTTAGLLLAILGTGASFAFRGGGTLQETAFGAFLLPSERGAYIIVGVAAFIVGVAVTLLCLRSRRPTFDVSEAGRPPGGAKESDLTPSPIGSNRPDLVRPVKNKNDQEAERKC